MQITPVVWSESAQARIAKPHEADAAWKHTAQLTRPHKLNFKYLQIHDLKSPNCAVSGW